jgi:hypothetical protein
LTKNVALGSFEESQIRSLFSNLPSECFAIVAPALHELAAEDDARRRKLGDSAFDGRRQRAARPKAGKFSKPAKARAPHAIASGTWATSSAPILSTIGQIRAERDILESIFFPSATLARDYEAHTIETADGQSLVAVIRRNLARCHRCRRRIRAGAYAAARPDYFDANIADFAHAHRSGSLADRRGVARSRSVSPEL